MPGCLCGSNGAASWLLLDDGRIIRSPLFEPVPDYRRSGEPGTSWPYQTFQQACQPLLLSGG
jgi:hypothetical protein